MKVSKTTTKKQKAKKDDPCIDLRHYSKEWIIIGKRIVELRTSKPKNKKEWNRFLHAHIRSKMRMLANDYNEAPEYVLESLSDKNKISIRHHVSPELHKTFKEISKKSRVPITSIIERLIITPLLIDK